MAFNKYLEIGLNPCTINELKNRLNSGYYDKTYHKDNETLMVKDELLISLMAQIDRICNITN